MSTDDGRLRDLLGSAPRLAVPPADAPGPGPGEVGGSSSEVVRFVDRYLAAVVRELRALGVITGSPQRTDPAQRLIGSIVLDCTALRLSAWRPRGQHAVDQHSVGDHPPGGAVPAEQPVPVVATWDERLGWCAGLHHSPTLSSRRYLHPELLPPAEAVAEFVVGLALGEPLGAPHPIGPPGRRRAQLRLVP